MSQLGDNPNEVLFSPGSTLEWRVMNYSDIQPFSYASPEEILMMLEEEFNESLCHVVFRIEAPARIHATDSRTYPTLPEMLFSPVQCEFIPVIDEYIARANWLRNMTANTELDRINEFLNHEKEMQHEEENQQKQARNACLRRASLARDRRQKYRRQKSGR